MTDQTLPARVVLDCSHASTCLPDYWGGHHLPHISVPVWHGMTLKELKLYLRVELRQGAVCGSTEDARLLSADLVRPNEEKRADALTRAAYAAINRIKPTKKGAKRLFTDLDPVDPNNWDGPSVYAYFVFVDITPDCLKNRYWLAVDDDCLDQARPYDTKLEAVQAYRAMATERAKCGQTICAQIHIAQERDDLTEYPDYILNLGPRGGVQVVRIWDRVAAYTLCESEGKIMDKTDKYGKRNEQYLGLIKAAGWRVFGRPGTSPRSRQYCYFTDGTNIGYAQWSDGRPMVSSVHKPSRTNGTGFHIADLITTETLREAAMCVVPAWGHHSETVTKYKDWDAFHQSSGFNGALVEL